MASLDLVYRPQSFSEYYGNEPLIRALEVYLDDPDKKHTVLFHGPRGCGKTTLGRILAQRLGCTGLTPPNYMEFDMAQNRGINEAKRNIIQACRFKPFGKGGVKVFLLDEVHLITKEAGGALLKTLEEPPEYVYFILCTTDPQKMLPTIISRCVKFEVKPLAMPDMQELLDDLCDAEGIKLSSKLKRKIIQLANGCPRDAITFVSQVRGLDEKDAFDVLGSGSTEANIIDICRIVASGKQGKWQAVQPLLGKLQTDPEAARMAFLGYFGKMLENAKNEKDAARARLFMSYFEEPFFNTGRSGLIGRIFDVCTDV